MKTFRLHSIVCAALLTASLLLPSCPGAEGPASDRAFRPKRVIPEQPAIVKPPVIAAGEVGDQVVDDELVLGVVVKGRARAYPINMLTGPSREIINDVLGGQAIAATW